MVRKMYRREMGQWAGMRAKTGSTEREMEVEKGYTTPKPASSD